MGLFRPKSDWYEKYWYSPKQPKKARWVSGFALRRLTVRARERDGKQTMSPASRLSRAISRWRPDTFVLALAATVTLATLLPCRGIGASIMGTLAMFAIGLLFFLQGARLSRDAIIAGMTNWRLHFAIGAATFALFPMLGTALTALVPHALTPTLVLGVLFLCALPSTVQSSIALTSRCCRSSTRQCKVKREFKMAAVSHGLRLNELLVEAFEAWKEKTKGR